MKRCILIAAVLLLLTGCDSVRFDDALAIRSAPGSIVSVYDDHGGFHGDGVRIETVFYPEDAFRAEVSESTEWRPLPMHDDAEQLLRRISPLLPEEIRGVMAQMAQGRYWFFRDRHARATDPSDVSAAIGRYSYNFSLAMYDMESQTLYYFEIDT